MILDRQGRSKGIGYVEYFDRSSVPIALQLTNQLCKGAAVHVQLTQSEKNRQASASAVTGSNASTRLIVSNLDVNIEEDDIRSLFDSFGSIDSIKLQTGADGKFIGSAIIEYQKAADAKNAASEMDGFNLADKLISVRLSSSSQPAQTTFNPNLPISSFNNLPPPLASIGQSPILSTGTTFLSSGLSQINPTTLASGLLPTLPILPSISPSSSTCLVLKNMFIPAEETEPEWWLDIQEETRNECTQFGEVTHCFVDKDSPGFVYLRFADVTSCVKAQEALHKRWFAGKMVSASYMLEAEYNAKFPNSK